ncbi:MAG: type II secretion system protein M [Burkholderiales bacterium]|nr:type II secretion system protein M [Burkholderiales bacterium]
MTELWNGYWQQRDQRERRMLSAAAAFIVLSLIYLLVLNPALSGRTQLQNKIPLLRQQVAEMAALSTQQAQLAASLSELVTPISREQVDTSLTRRGVKSQALAVSDDIVRLQILSVNYSDLMEWLVEMQKASRLTVEEARVTALPEKGQVSVSLTLKQQRNAS